MSRDVKDAPVETREQSEGLSDTKAILRAAHGLPKTARAELAAAMLRSLDEEEEEDPAVVEAAWEKELLRRLEDLRAGRLETVSAAEVLADLDAIVNEAREA